jgi:hypothetical protein
MSALANLWLRGTRNPHVLYVSSICTFWFLRAVRFQFNCARLIFKLTLVGSLIHDQSLQNRSERFSRAKTQSLVRDIPLLGRRAASKHATKRMKCAAGLGGLV